MLLLVLIGSMKIRCTGKGKVFSKKYKISNIKLYLEISSLSRKICLSHLFPLLWSTVSLVQMLAFSLELCIDLNGSPYSPNNVFKAEQDGTKFHLPWAKFEKNVDHKINTKVSNRCQTTAASSGLLLAWWQPLFPSLESLVTSWSCCCARTPTPQQPFSVGLPWLTRFFW